MSQSSYCKCHDLIAAISLPALGSDDGLALYDPTQTIEANAMIQTWDIFSSGQIRCSLLSVRRRPSYPSTLEVRTVG